MRRFIYSIFIILRYSIAFTERKKMAINTNQIVSMNYELKINGDILESNFDASPIEFTYGTGQIVPGLEAGIKEMSEGETKTILVEAKDAYGEHDEKLTESLPIADFEGINLEIGMVLDGENEQGELFKATVTDVTKEHVTVDYNHPLAGCDLEFRVLIQKIA